eukprot:CAMPEP_0118884988 /NCGR_PEP_ID=MMETSP1163-20130328/23644_1 /TAXON_ID=124430 /ORGANISM="Phaeomonas parva, Strain CCMP2877" /LENGTH=46 /DNA_ID= /DNA_START= /DNA_END= /DNA_ORIENTATION=
MSMMRRFEDEKAAIDYVRQSDYVSPTSKTLKNNLLKTLTPDLSLKL